MNKPDKRFTDEDEDDKPPSLMPASWTFKETISRQEVLLQIEQDPEFANCDYEEAAQKLANFYMLTNLHRLKRSSPQEREDYYQECARLSGDIEQRNKQPKSAIENKALQLEKALDGSITGEQVQVIKDGALALQELQKVEDKQERTERIGALVQLMRTTSARINAQDD